MWERGTKNRQFLNIIVMKYKIKIGINQQKKNNK